MSTEEVVESRQGEETPSQGTEAAAVEELAAPSVSGEEQKEEGVQEGAAAAAPQEGQLPSLSDDQKVGLLEALLLASGDPLPISRIEELLGCSKDDVLALAESLKGAYAAENRGLELVNVSSKLQLRTKAIYADYVRNLIAIKPRKLSQAALETLAVIAYQQPVVKSEIDKIRGVDVAPTIKTLLERNLVKILGYQASVGQPALYGTTEEFLSIFGLASLAELPSLRDLKALVKEPGEALQGEGDGESQDESDGGEVDDLSATPSTEPQASEAAPSVQ
jgi:segregation and condensation protein B